MYCLGKIIKIGKVLLFKMAVCEMCGREDFLVNANVEGAVMTVCKVCAGYGKIVKREIGKGVRLPQRRINLVKTEVEEGLVSDFAVRLRRARGEMKQEDFSKKINEKESLVQKWENGSMAPRLSIARKLERILGVNLVEKVNNSKEDLDGLFKKSKSGEVTLGDMIKIRKRK